jgi:hypothetical protein
MKKKLHNPGIFKIVIMRFFLVLIALFGVNGLFAQQSQTVLTTVSSSPYAVPSDIIRMRIELWGGGGAGGGVPNSNNVSAGGGAGGSYTKGASNVTPSANITFTVGTGGAGVSNATGGTGGTSTFNSTTAFSAIGGAGGTTSATSAGAVLTTGVTLNGGAGGNGVNGGGGNTSGGGGGGAGSTGSGTAGSGGTGGAGGAGDATGTGGTGRNGQNTPGIPVAATGISAGGAGARNTNSGSAARVGGAGSNGQIRLTYYLYSLTTTTASSPICTGGSSTVGLTASATGLPSGTYTVTYNLSGANTITGATASMTVTSAGIGSFAISSGFTNVGSTTVTVTSLESVDFGSKINSNNTATVTVNGAPTIASISAPSALCSGGSLNPTAPTVTANGSTVTSQGWQLETGVGSGVFANLTVPYTVTSADNGKKIRYTATNGCGTTNSNEVVVTVNTASVAPTSISGTTTICNGGSTILTAVGGTLGTGANYQWGTGAVVGTSPLGGQTASTLTVSPSSATTYWVRIESTTSPCTANTTGVTQLVTVNTPSVAPTSITGTTTICSPNSTTLTAVGGTLGTGANYQWGTGAVVGTSPLGGKTASTLTVSPSSATTYWVRIESTTSPCTANTTGVTQLVTVNTPSVAPTSISGTTTVCNGSSTTLTAVGGTLGTGANYQWGTGAVVGTSPLGGQTASTLTVSPSGATTYWVRIESTTSPCTANTTGVSQLITVNTPSIAPTSISGTTNVCNGDSTTLTAVGGTLGTGANYQWGTGAVVGTSPLLGETASTLTVSPGSSITYWVRIESTTSPCTANTTGVTQLVTVNTPSVAPTSISGTTTVCNGSSTTLTAVGGTLGTGANYQWGTGAVVGTSPLGGQTASTLTVSPSGATTYWVRIESTTSPCTANTTGVSQLITVNTPSIAPTSISGTTNVCNGDSTTLTAVGGTLGTGANYQWGTGAVLGTSPLLGETASTLTVSPSIATTYWVRIESTTSPCTANTTGVTQLVSINTLSVAPTGATGTTTICYGGNTTLTVDGGSTGTGAVAEWFTVSCGGTPAGTGSSINISPVSTTTYYVRYNGTCNTTTCGTVTVTVSTATVWTGATSTAWNTTSNWACGVLPASVSDVTISTATFYPEISSDVTVNTLTLDSGTTLKVNSLYNLTVTDVIDNEGTVTIENDANLLQVNDVANTGSGSTEVKRNTNPLIRFDYVLWSSPVASQGLFSFSPLTTISPSVRFYTYNTATNLYSSIPSGSIATEQFATGTGYLIRVPFNHPTAAAVWNGVFTGVPNNGDFSVPISTAGTPANLPNFPFDRYGFNLIGNPYPSPISISQFATDNSDNIETTFYFWRKTNNSSSPSYCTWNSASNSFGDNGEAYTETPNDVIQTGQGFIVQAKTGATAVEFNNGQRLANNAGQFFRNAQQGTASPATIESNRMWLNMQGATGGFSQAVVGYFTNATLGADDFDSKLFNDGPIAFSSIINNEDYVIQGRPVPFDLNDVVPMRYKVANAGAYTISIDHVDGIFAGGVQTIYIHDNLTSTIHDLNSGAYNFTSDAGTFATRFEVIYQPQLGTGGPVFNENQVVIYQNEANEFVINTGNIVMSSVKIFDVRGRFLSSSKEINANQTTITAGQVNQVLLIQITSQDGLVVTKKVIR